MLTARLIFSEMTGSIADLHQAMAVNPAEWHQMEKAFKRAENNAPTVKSMRDVMQQNLARKNMEY